MIRAEGLTKYYADRIALDSVSFEIRQGECIGFLGRNGAGKSTTLKILATALLPSAGTVTVDGFDVVGQPGEVRKRIGYLPEDAPLYPEMTVEAFLSFLGGLRGLSESELPARVEEAVKRTNLQEVFRRPIGTLSLGFKKRVAIAQAIVHRPKLLIIDEPISGLDPVQIAEIRELIRSFRGEHTILLSSHILTEVSQTCDRILVIDRGRLVAQGTESELTKSVAKSLRIEVEVRGTREAFAKALSQVPQVVGQRLLSESAGTLTAEVDLSSDAREALSQAIVGAGLGLRRLASGATGLESIFLELTGEERRAA